MRRISVLLLVFFLLIPVHAQNPERHACITELELMQNITDRDLSADCAIYTSCQEAGESYCYLRVIIANLENCEADDTQCHAEAKLLGLSFELYETSFINEEVRNSDLLQESYNSIPAAFSQFRRGGQPTDIYEDLANGDYGSYVHPLAFAANGLLAEYSGNSEEALAYYRSAIEGTVFDAALYWMRAELLLEMGQIEKASFDAFLFAHLVEGDAEISPIAADLRARAPLDESTFEDWIYYPVNSVGISPGGNRTTDYSYLPASPLRFLMLEDTVLMEKPDTVELGTSVWMILDRGIPFYGDDYGFSTALARSYYGPVTWAINLFPIEGGDFRLEVKPYVFEGGTSYNAMLRPADQPDPRLQAGEFRCSTESPRSRLMVGTSVRLDDMAQLGYSLDASMDNLLSDRGGSITLLAGPICIDGAIWYWAELGNLEIKAWVLEVNGTGAYAFESFPFEELPELCNDTLPPRFTVGARGLVVPDLGANNLRAEPNSSAELIGEMPPNAEFTVVGEAVCTDGLSWWQVDYEGTIAWTAEGDEGVYWLEPSLNQE